MDRVDRAIRAGLAAGCLIGVLTAALVFGNEQATGALTAGFGLAISWSFRGRQVEPPTTP